MKTALDAFNNSGDSYPLPSALGLPSPNALPSVAKATAGVIYADANGENQVGATGIVAFNDVYWTGSTGWNGVGVPQPRDQ